MSSQPQEPLAAPPPALAGLLQQLTAAIDAAVTSDARAVLAPLLDPIGPALAAPATVPPLLDRLEDLLDRIGLIAPRQPFPDE